MKIVSLVYISTVLVAASITGCVVQKPVADKAAVSDTIRIPGTGNQLALEVSFSKGEAHNHPSFAIWIEDMNENYIQTLFITRSVGTGIYGHGRLDNERWDNKPGPQKRPASLPYWLHKRSSFFGVPLLPDSAHPVTDGYTGATPSGDFVIKTGIKQGLPEKFRILMEINQPWDWNEFWTNSLYNDLDYRTSCQPSLIYAVTIDQKNPGTVRFLNPVGHGHYSGKDGNLYTDLTTFTTALEILDKATVTLIK